ncbi:MAG: 30S ribosomal protein S21 [Rickettsiales bacterium]|nr:30S ribosomal protein S21 [Rickettsiales bacterium]
MVQVIITDQNRLEMGIRIFKKKTQREGILKESRRRAEYESPSEKRKRKLKESISRAKRKKK